MCQGGDATQLEGVDPDAQAPRATLREAIGLEPLKADRKHLELVGLGLLQAMGEDPDRDGLKETPRRFADFWASLGEDDSQAAVFAEDTWREIVVVSGIEAWSICEHHLLPFRCRVSIGYMPRGEVIGLSKLPRLVRLICGRPQVQERISREIAEAVKHLAGTPNVAVLIEGWHLCMAMRGAKSNATTTTFSASGELDHRRQEFLALAGRNRPET